MGSDFYISSLEYETRNNNRAQVQDLKIINKINRAINNGKSLKDIVKLFSRLVKKALNAYALTVYISDENENYLELQNLDLDENKKSRIAEILGFEIPKIRLSLADNNEYKRIFYNGNPKLFDTKESIKEITKEFANAVVLEKKSLKEVTERLTNLICNTLGIKSIIISHIVYKDKLIGLTDLSSKNILTKEDLKRYRLLCNQFSMALIRKRNESNLKKGKETFEILFNNANDPIFFYNFYGKPNKPGKFIKVNEIACKKTGYSRDEILDLTPLDLLDENSKKKVPYIRNELTKNLNYTYEMVIELKNGKKIPVEINSKKFMWKGREAVMSIARDISNRKKAEDEIKYISFHDKLTGLYNRSYFEEELKRLDTRRQLPLCIIIGDVNGLKLINDAFGHSEGDKLLKLAAKVLLDCFRVEDIVARWGGDEFAILLPKTSKETANLLIKRIKDRLLVDDRSKIPLSISLGLAAKTKAYQDIDEKLLDAECDMYKVKLSESKEVSTSIVYSLKNTLKTKTDHKPSTDRKIAELAIKLGKTAKLPNSILGKINLISSFYDIGMISIPDDLLKNKGKPNTEEWNLIKKHPEIGFHICIASPHLSHIAYDVLSHHEYWDGEGYPQGLKGENIPMLARIISIVVAYHKMKNGSKYKPPMAKDAIIEELRNKAGKQFDSNLVNKLIPLIEDN